MILFNRLLTFLAPFAMLFLAEVLLREPLGWWVYGSAAVLAQLIATLNLMRWNVLSLETWVFTWLTIAVTACIMAWTLIVGEPLLQHLILISGALMLLLFYDHLFDFLYQKFSYQSYSLEHISRYMLLGMMFAGTALSYAAPLFLPVSRLLVVGLTILFLLINTAISVWFLKFETSGSRWLTVILALSTIQLYWVFALLPLHYYVNAFVVTLAFYAILNLGHYALKHSLNKKILRRYGIAICVLLALVLGTAEWF